MKPGLRGRVGSHDSAARFAAAGALLMCANHGYVWGYAGFAVAATAAGFCPLYWLLGINTTACDRAPAPAAAPRQESRGSPKENSVELRSPWRVSSRNFALVSKAGRSSR